MTVQRPAVGAGAGRSGRGRERGQVHLADLVADEGLRGLGRWGQDAAAAVVHRAEQRRRHPAAGRRVEGVDGQLGGEPGPGLAVRQQHGGGGEAVTAGVRALPHLARPRRGRLEGDGPAAYGAADVAPGVRAHQQGRFARGRQRRQRRQRRAEVAVRERVERQPEQLRGVGDVAGEQPRGPARPPATRTRREVGWWASACWPGRRISSSRPPAS